MRDLDRQRVVCTGCGWTGGRAATGDPGAAPCFKCGATVELVGAVYREQRVLCGCTACGWWGERSPARVGSPCPKCPAPATEAVLIVTKAGGAIVA